jgi:tetratricopeptide (TPR) repeat protein
VGGNEGMMQTHDVVVSYLREDRRYVESKALDLLRPGMTVVYDEYEYPDLQDRNFYKLLSNLARHKTARYAIILLPRTYDTDRNNIHRRVYHKKRFIFFVDLDNFSTGIPPTVLYLRIDKKIPPIAAPPPPKNPQDISLSDDKTDTPAPGAIVVSSQPSSPPESNPDEARQAKETKEKLLRKGAKHLEEKGFAAALEAYREALLLDYNDVRIYNGLGNALWCLGRYDEALSAFEQANRLDPEKVEAYNGLGNALWCLGRYDEALLAFEQATRMVPTDHIMADFVGVYRFVRLD